MINQIMKENPDKIIFTFLKPKLISDTKSNSLLKEDNDTSKDMDSTSTARNEVDRFMKRHGKKGVKAENITKNSSTQKEDQEKEIDNVDITPKLKRQDTANLRKKILSFKSLPKTRNRTKTETGPSKKLKESKKR